MLRGFLFAITWLVGASLLLPAGVSAQDAPDYQQLLPLTQRGQTVALWRSCERLEVLDASTRLSDAERSSLNGLRQYCGSLRGAPSAPPAAGAVLNISQAIASMGALSPLFDRYTRARAVCGRTTVPAPLAAWCENPMTHPLPSLAEVGLAAPPSSARGAASPVTPRGVTYANNTLDDLFEKSNLTGTPAGEAAASSVAITDVLLRGLAQFLATRATAELQEAVVTRIREQVCLDASSACAFSAGEWDDLRDDMDSACEQRCTSVSVESANACWRLVRASGYVDHNSGTQWRADGCQGLAACATCVEGRAAELRKKRDACFRATLSSRLTVNTCAVLGRPFDLSPSFGQAFRSAVVQDIIALPGNMLEVLQAPLGVRVERGDEKRLAQTFILRALYEVTQASEPSQVGHGILSFVRGWSCTDDSENSPCTKLKASLQCAFEIFNIAAEQSQIAAHEPVPEGFLSGLLDPIVSSGSCAVAHPNDPNARQRRDLLTPFVRTFSRVIQDLQRLSAQSRAASAARPATDRSGASRSDTRADEPSDETPIEPVVQTLARDLVQAVNLAVQIGSLDPNRPEFVLPGEIPDFVGAAATHDIPGAVSYALRIIARIIEQFTPVELRDVFTVPSGVVRVLSFGAELATARTPEAVASTLNDFSAPVGSWRGKGRRRMFSITGVVGLGGGLDYTLTRGAVPATLDAAFAPVGMVGMNLTAPTREGFFREVFGVEYLGLYLSVLDVGALVAQTATTPRTSGEQGSAVGASTSATLNPLQFVTPGLFFQFNFARSPLNLMVGGQYLPFARTLEYSDAAGQARSVDVSAFRAMVLLGVDITILPF